MSSIARAGLHAGALVTHLQHVACRYVHYYANVVQHGQPKIKQLQLRQIVLAGLSGHALSDLIVIVKMRPPGAGWKTELVCLAASKPQETFLDGAPAAIST